MEFLRAAVESVGPHGADPFATTGPASLKAE